MYIRATHFETNNPDTYKIKFQSIYKAIIIQWFISISTEKFNQLNRVEGPETDLMCMEIHNTTSSSVYGQLVIK